MFVFSKNLYMGSNRRPGLGINVLLTLFIPLVSTITVMIIHFVIYGADNNHAYIILYVNDILLVTSSTQLRQHFVSLIGVEFTMKDLGRIHYSVGIAATHTPQGLFLSQSKYAQEIIACAGMSSCKPVTTPVDSKGKLNRSFGDSCNNPTLYQSFAKALQYLSFIRTDISYVVQQVCLHMHAPLVTHKATLKLIIRYLQGTSHFGLHITRSSSCTLVSYTNIDWASYPDTCQSTSRYCVYIGDNLISWSYKPQSTLSHSHPSAEANYRSIANVVAESC